MGWLYTTLDWLANIEGSFVLFRFLRQISRKMLGRISPKPLDITVGKQFKNREVLLDGQRYVNCTFENVTFLYRGKAPFKFDYFDYPELRGNNKLSSPMPQFGNIINLLNLLGMLNPAMEVSDAPHGNIEIKKRVS